MVVNVGVMVGVACVYCVDDFSRVKLEAIEGMEGSDYINASYIDVGCHMTMLAHPPALYMSPAGLRSAQRIHCCPGTYA